MMTMTVMEHQTLKTTSPLMQQRPLTLTATELAMKLAQMMTVTVLTMLMMNTH